MCEIQARRTGRRRASALMALPLAGILLFVSGCGGGGGNGDGSPPPGPPVITSVSVSGPAYSQAGYCGGFTATVKGSGNFDRTVKWYVNDVLGGSADTGTISNGGSYCAPGTPPASNPVNIKAVANGDSTKSGNTSTRIIAIQISPTQANLHVNDTQQFTAAAQGAVDNTIVWLVNGVAGGNSTIGTITNAGLYKAPAQVSNMAISVEAEPADTNTVSATANISVSGRVLISPQNPDVAYGGTQQFTATLVGTTDTSVSWRAQYGTITPSGLYTASRSESPDTIFAWSAHADGTATVQITGPQPVITSISPQPATAGQQITITGQNLQAIATAIFSDSAGGQIPALGSNANGSSFTVIVPQGTVTGPFLVQTQVGGLPPVNSNVLTFQRLARLRIRTPKRDLSAGESVTLQYAFLGDSTPASVIFSADLGSFSGATYVAPANVPTDTFAHVTACIFGTQSCDTLLIGLHPFRIAPNVPLVAKGQSLQLSAILGGGVTGANWNLLAGGGTLTPGGLYTAGSRLIDGGPAIVTATSGAATEQGQIGVTGGFPGLLNRIVDYVDQHDLSAEGTVNTGLAIIGSKLYVSASNHAGAFSDSYFWIDVYDLSDPLNPVWINAVESNSAGPISAYGPYLFSFTNVDIAVPSYPNTLTLYTLQNGLPVLKARTSVPSWWSAVAEHGILSIVPFNSAPRGYAEITLYDFTTGTITIRDFNIQLPPDAQTFGPDTCLAVGNRLFVSDVKDDLTAGSYILTYDLTTSPPALLGKIEGRSLRFHSEGNLLFGALGGMDTYDISNTLPQYLSHVDGINAWQLDGTKLLAITLQQGFRMVDMSNPAAPKVTGVLFDGIITGYSDGLKQGNYVYSAQGVDGIQVYDSSRAGGPIDKAIDFGGAFPWGYVFDQLLRYPYLYAANSTGIGGVLNVYDVSATPTTGVGYYLDQNQLAYAVQAAGNNLYLGMSRSLQVFDVTNPGSPIPTSFLALPVFTLDRSGSVLFAGTFDNRLLTLDVSNTQHPQVLNSYPLPSQPIRVHVFGNLLLVADNIGGLLVYDISAPATPVLLSQFTGLTAVNDVVLAGTTAFVAADIDGFAVVDLTNPSQPVLISKTYLNTIDPYWGGQPPNQAISIAMNGGIIYVGTYNDNGLVFGFDVSNLQVPRQVSAYAYGGFILTAVESMLFHGNDLFIGGPLGYSSFAQADVSQPLNSINTLFPPLALQNPGPLPVSPRTSRFTGANVTAPRPAPDPKFWRTSPDAIPTWRQPHSQ